MASQKDIKEPVLLLGAYGRGNAGDDVFAVCAAELFKDYSIYINSAHNSLLPEDVKGKVQTISTVSAGDIANKIKLFFAIKKVVYWGGDLWVGLYGTKTPRQLLYKMILLNLLLKATGKKVYYVGVGIGQLSGYSLWLARTSAKLAKQVVVREQRSADVLRLANVAVLPDIAVNLPYNKPALHILPVQAPFTIVVSLLYSIPEAPTNFPKLIGTVAEFINQLPIDQFRIVILPMHNSDKEPNDDLWASRELVKAIKNDNNVEIFVQKDLASIVALLRESHLIIGGRLHANILGIFNGTPAIGISYRPKVRSFFKDLDLERYCLDLDDVAQISLLFVAMYENYSEVAKLFYDKSIKAAESKKAYQHLVDGL